MKLEIMGEYDERWVEITLEAKRLADWRCVRCRHPFDATTRAPRGCDAQCDVRRCRAEVIAARDGTHNLTTHHLDGDKSNNRWWNLLVLCNSCHLYVQASVLPHRAFMFHHTPWFVPYVSGFYAFQKGIEITREQALEDPERWLQMGQPWLYEDARLEAVEASHA